MHGNMNVKYVLIRLESVIYLEAISAKMMHALLMSPVCVLCPGHLISFSVNPTH